MSMNVTWALADSAGPSRGVQVRVRIGRRADRSARRSAATGKPFRPATGRRVKLRAGLPDIHFHDIRKKTASDADTPQHAAALLAYTDEATTRRVHRAKPTPIAPVRQTKRARADGEPLKWQGLYPTTRASDCLCGWLNVPLRTVTAKVTAKSF